MRVFLLALVVLALVAIGLAQTTSNSAVAVNSTTQLATKEEIEQLVGHPISDEEWNKPVGLDPSPAVLLGSTQPTSDSSASGSDSSAAPALRPLAFLSSF